MSLSYFIVATKIEYDLKKTIHFLFWSRVLYFVNCDFYNYILSKNNAQQKKVNEEQSMYIFFPSILYGYMFYCRNLLMYLNCIVS